MLTSPEIKPSWWSDALLQLRIRLGEGLFGMWFAGIVPKGLTEEILQLSVPTPYHLRRLSTGDYYLLLLTTLQEQLPQLQSLEISVDVELAASAIAEEATLSSPRLELVRPTQEMSKRVSPPFDTRLQFSSLVVGESNRFAAEACRTVAENPGRPHLNPLVLHGGTGLGKTHLLQALGQMAWELQSAESIRLTNSDQLLAEFKCAGQKQDLHGFFSSYIAHDLILIDDVQGFAGKKWMEEQFSKLIRALRSHGRQVVVTSDQPLDQLKWLNASTPEGFREGIAIEVERPTSEHRLEILRAKMCAHAGLPDGVLEFIAENFSSNVRELEGVLLKLIAYQEFFAAECTVEIAASVLSDHLRDQRQSLTLEMIASEVAHAFGVTSDHLKSVSRRKEFTLPRKVAMFLANSLLDLTLHSIGLYFNRDFSTVHASIKSINQLTGRDTDLSDRVEQLRDRLLLLKKS